MGTVYSYCNCLQKYFFFPDRQTVAKQRLSLSMQYKVHPYWCMTKSRETKCCNNKKIINNWLDKWSTGQYVVFCCPVVKRLNVFIAPCRLDLHIVNQHQVGGPHMRTCSNDKTYLVCSRNFWRVNVTISFAQSVWILITGEIFLVYVKMMACHRQNVAYFSLIHAYHVAACWKDTNMKLEVYNKCEMSPYWLNYKVLWCATGLPEHNNLCDWLRVKCTCRPYQKTN